MNIPLRPSMHDHSYPHSMPHSPYGHLRDLPPPPHPDIDAALSHAYRSLPRGYFNMPAPSAGPYPPDLRPGSPLSISQYSPGFPFSYGTDLYGNSESPYHAQQSIPEMVRKTNLAVQLVNGQISPPARHAQLQPKMLRDGSFPAEFRTPRTVEEVHAMDSSTIERILLAYHLPTDLRSFKMNTLDTVPSKVSKQAKLCTLFDFLGATRLADSQRISAEKWRGRAILAY